MGWGGATNSYIKTMIETKDISKMVKHIMRRNRGVVDPQIMHPMREWVIGIVITLIGMLGGSILAASLYQYYDAKMDTEVAVAATVVPYDAAVVEAALSQYRIKQAQYEAVVGMGTAETATTTSLDEIVSASSTVNLVQVEEVLEPVVESEESVTEPTEGVVLPDLAI